MSSGIEQWDSLMSVREKPWHGLGVVLEEHPKSIEEAIQASGLDWNVVQKPVLAEFDGTIREAEGYYVNLRDDLGIPLGVVTSRYSPVQNVEAFSFLADVFGSEMHFETAGSLMNGRRVWVLMRLPTWIEVGGDAIGRYAFISNSHDGKSSVVAAMTPVRIVCQNTEYAALNIARRQHRAARTYTIRHLGDMEEKMREARNVMEMTVHYYEKFKEVGDQMAREKISNQRVTRYLEMVLPIKEGMGDRAAKNRLASRTAIKAIYKGDSDHPETQGNSPRTLWALYNAATEWADWYRSERKGGGRFQRSLDDPDGFKARAWEVAVEMAGV